MKNNTAQFNANFKPADEDGPPLADKKPSRLEEVV